MRVLITTQVFPPEVHPTAVMVKELATALAGRGYEVTVAAGLPHHPYGRLYPGYEAQWLKTENENGFQVVRGWHLISPNPALFSRALVMASQCAAYFWGVMNRPEVVISYGPPLIGPLASAIIARSCGAKLIIIIYDIYPDILVESGHLQNSFLITALGKLERLSYQLSDRIGVLSEGFRYTLIEEKEVPAEKVTVIPVWLDAQDIVPKPRDNLWCREMGIGPEKFVVLYAGTIGLVSGAEVVVEAAKNLQSYEDILFLFVGSGHARDRVEAEARKAGLRNMRFLPFQPRERLSEVQATADISLVTLAPGRGKTSVPSKVLGYMAAGRPVLAAVDAECDTADMIKRAECGVVVPPGNAKVIREAILNFFKNPHWRQSSGLKGRRYLEENFERSRVLGRFLDLVAAVGKRQNENAA